MKSFSLILVYLSLGLFLGPKALYAKENFNKKKVYFFSASFKQVWQATQQVLSSYPLEINDRRGGLIKTQVLSTTSIWRAPFEKDLPPNFKEIISIRFIKQGFMSTKMIVHKKSKVQKDFLGNIVRRESSGWEELRLYYKIRREIEIKDILKMIKIR